MQAILKDVAVLEISSREYEGKVYNNLVVYEYGQRFPNVRVLRLHADQIEEAKRILGKRASILATIYEKRDKPSQYAFAGIAA